MCRILQLKLTCCKSSLPRAGNARAGHLFFSTDGDGGTKNPSPPTLCQVNNHPNYRLKLAKERFGAGNGTSKGQQSKIKQSFTTPKRLRVPPKRIRYHESVREHGISVQCNENPIIKNDGTSSGAVAAERLRLARRRAIESLARQIQDTTNVPTDTSKDASPSQIQQHGKAIKQHGLDIVAYENPVRINDGTSSGAVAADRLRMARRRALESMRQPVKDDVIEPSETNDTYSHYPMHEKPVQEHGLDIVAYENPVRLNDGTSSGAVAADRLRIARRKALESLSKS